MKTLSRLICLLIVAIASFSTWALVAQVDTGKKIEPAKALFHLNFDNGFSADTTTGTAAPTNDTNRPDLVEGIKGKAAFFGPDQYLRFNEKGNLDKQAGSFCVWLQAPVDDVGLEGKRYTVFAEDGPNALGSTLLWAWLHGGTNLRFDVRDPKDQYTYFMPPRPWKKGDWHQVVYTWDAGGRVQVYADTHLVADKLMGKWTPKPYEAFFLGAMNAKGENPWGAAIDEVSIYDRPLTAAEVRQEYRKIAKLPVNVTLLDPYFTAGKTETLRLELTNDDFEAAELSNLTFEIKSADGKVVQQGTIPSQSVAGSAHILATQTTTVIDPGTYTFVLNYTAQGASKSYEDTLTVLPARETPATEPTKLSLVDEVDATKKTPLAQIGDSTVISSAAEEYREAAPRIHDRFALDFTIKDVRAPHVAVITYPDDKPRTMEITLQDLSGKNDYQAQTGLFAGDEYPLSNKMLETRIYFWPHSTKQSFIFMTAKGNEPAAVKDIKVYQLDHLTPSPHTGQFSGSVPNRRIGVYFEDCVLNQVFGTTPDREGFIQATDLLLDYMQMSGQTELCYPVAWYHGPLYGTLVEPTQPDIAGSTGGSRPHPPGYPALLLKKLEARDMKFSAGAHIHWLPSLDPWTITDQDRVDKGEETVVNVRGDGKLWFGHWHGSDPNYNPTDPRVLGAVKAVINEIVERYGQEPAFTGVTLVMARNKLYTFGSIESGYNDSNLQAFQKESGTTIPVYVKDKSTRFADSYHWLMDHPDAKKAWIDWRCKKLHDHYKQIADAMTAQRPDLKLTLDIFTDRTSDHRIANYLGEPAVETMRETGIDPRLYANDANIIMSYTLVPADYRIVAANNTAADLEDNRTAMLAPEIAESMGPLPQTGVILHDRYWEDPIGHTNPLPLKDFGVKETEWRVSTLNAPSFHSLEPYVAALNNFDALHIDKGGFLIGTFGMENELTTFGEAFDALPAVRFDDVESVSDPVRVRQKVVDGKLYFYVLNRLPSPVVIKLSFKENQPLDEPATGKTFPAANEMTLQLAPYDLQVFRSASATQSVTGGETTIDPALLKMLEAKLDQLQKDADAKRDTPSVAKLLPYLDYAQKCWKQKAYARLYFLLQESWAADLERP